MEKRNNFDTPINTKISEEFKKKCKENVKYMNPSTILDNPSHFEDTKQRIRNTTLKKNI